MVKLFPSRIKRALAVSLSTQHMVRSRSRLSCSIPNLHVLAFIILIMSFTKLSKCSVSSCTLQLNTCRSCFIRLRSTILLEFLQDGRQFLFVDVFFPGETCTHPSKVPCPGGMDKLIGLHFLTFLVKLCRNKFQNVVGTFFRSPSGYPRTLRFQVTNLSMFHGDFLRIPIVTPSRDQQQQHQKRLVGDCPDSFRQTYKPLSRDNLVNKSMSQLMGSKVHRATAS